MVIFIVALSQLVAVYIAHDYLLISISLLVFYLIGLLTYWILIKLNIT